MSQSVLILGATGRFGRNMATAFDAAGWEVRRFDRSRDDLEQASQGVDMIVHGWNPTYDKWETDVPVLTQKVIKAARATGATVLIPGNVYVYGKDAPAVWRSDTPFGATNPMGQIRITMEQAFENSGVRVILLRAGDFIDTEASGNWFDKIIVKSLAKGRFSYPGKRHIPHAWAYLPDYCRAFVALAETRKTLPRYTSLNYEGYTLSGQQMAEILGVRAEQMNWLPIFLIAPFWKMGRCFLQMRYLWNKPHRMDGSAFRAVLPDFRETPVHIALQRAVSFQIDPDQSMIGTGATV